MKIKVRQGVGMEKEDLYRVALPRQILVSIPQRLLGACPRDVSACREPPDRRGKLLLGLR